MDMNNSVLESSIATLRPFMPRAELDTIEKSCRGEEGSHFRAKLWSMADKIDAMPRTCQTENETDPFAHLHYFKGGGDWYITELDMYPEQQQAFGLACPFGDRGELGYISLIELCANNVELDLYWTPKRLSEILKEKSA